MGIISKQDQKAQKAKKFKTFGFNARNRATEISTAHRNLPVANLQASAENPKHMNDIRRTYIICNSLEC
jgi:hypothetical protein